MTDFREGLCAAGRGSTCTSQPLGPRLTPAADSNVSMAGNKRADASSLGRVGPPNRKYH